MDVLVNKDWGSTGVWVPSRSGGWANTSFASLNLPDWLVERFVFWSAWYESRTPEKIDEEFDWDSWNAYELSLAIDLKNFLGNEHRVFVLDEAGLREIHKPRIHPESLKVDF